MSQRIRYFAVCEVFLLIFVLALPIRSEAILAEVTVPELVQMADHVVHGRVLSTATSWNDDKTQILTTVMIRIDEAYAGQLADSSVVKVVCPGGVVDGLAMEVEHTPVFAVNEDVILFLTTIDNSAFRVSGWEAGKFTVKSGKVAENGLLITRFEKQIVDAVKAAGRR